MITLDKFNRKQTHREIGKNRIVIVYVNITDATFFRYVCANSPEEHSPVDLRRSPTYNREFKIQPTKEIE